MLFYVICIGLGGGGARAQQPLSAIEWLNTPLPVPVVKPRVPPLNEPPVASGVSVPEVIAMPLDDLVRDAVGLLPSSVTGLPATLWSASRENDLITLWGRMADDPLPEIQALYYTLLLAEADAPHGASGGGGHFLATRIDSLLKLGAVDPAQALLERAGPVTPELFERWFDLSLLNGDEGEACKALRGRPELHPDYAARIYCLARTGDWPTAALLYDTAHALDMLNGTQQRLLSGFLHSESAEIGISLAPPRNPSPLIFRLYEAIGTPLPTRGLPIAFATADLRNTSGWKAELEAAERLVRTGALSENRLLGLYTERRPAASGGVWDRVAAVQRLETALSAKDGAAVSRALPTAWNQMHMRQLEVPFARLFAHHLIDLNLPAEVQPLAYRILLLSDQYETATLPDNSDQGLRFLATLAKGAPKAELASTQAERAILRAFASPISAAPQQAALLRDGKLGEAILSAANQFDQAAGSLADITAALRSLRAMGLEDTARCAALQLLILKARQ